MSFLYIKLTQIYILACLFCIFLYSTRMQYSYMPFFCAAVRTILANACLNLLEDDQGAVFFLFIVSNLRVFAILHTHLDESWPSSFIL